MQKFGTDAVLAVTTAGRATYTRNNIELRSVTPRRTLLFTTGFIPVPSHHHDQHSTAAISVAKSSCTKMGTSA